MSEEPAIVYAQLVAGLMLADGTVTVTESMYLTQVMTKLGLKTSQHRLLLRSSGSLAMVGPAVALLDAEQRATILGDLEAAAIADGLKVAEEQAFIDEVALALVDG